VTAAAPAAPGTARSASSQRLEWAAVGALAAGAFVLFVTSPTYPTYDSYYSLVWGRELLDGLTPSFTAYQAPTEHPLYLALGALLTLLGGDSADRMLVALALAAFVALVWGTYRLGAAAFGAWPGVAAAGFVLTSGSLVIYAVRAYVDTPFLAIVVWAAALAVRRPGRPLAVLALLALAGMLRPEAWLLAGLYALWRLRGLAPRERVLACALVAAGPLVWALTDLAVTGDPLFSLHATGDLASELGRTGGVSGLPAQFVAFLSEAIRLPVAIAGAIGLVLAVRLRARDGLVVPLALVGAGALTFLATGIAGLAIVPRYLTVPALGLCLFAGYALLGFTTLERGSRARRRWAAAAGAGAVVGAAVLVVIAPSVGRVTRELRFTRDTHRDFVALLRTPQARASLACGPLQFPTRRLVPDARWVLHLRPARVVARSQRQPAYGVALYPLGVRAVRRFGFADGAKAITMVPDPRYARADRERYFVAYVRC